jgi:hypothetical protein
VRVLIYNAATGEVLRSFSGSRHMLDEQLRPGEAFIESAAPVSGTRIEGGAVVDAAPPAPSPDYEWNAAARRFDLTPRRQRAEDAKVQIDALERQQLRALREHAIGRGGTPAQLRKRLEDIDDQITTLREQLQ